MSTKSLRRNQLGATANRLRATEFWLAVVETLDRDLGSVPLALRCEAGTNHSHR
jgi:hypothetical protein